MRYLIEFSYDGSNFYGYQKQKDKRTVQQCLEASLTTLNRENKVLVSASGRTDAKVHALGQCAHFDMKYEVKDLKKALNSLLPEDIHIINVKEVQDNFHARFNVTKKEYHYKINIGEYNPTERNYVYQYNKDLDLESMKKALVYLEGEHNFKSFAKTDDNKENFIRTIYEAELSKDNNLVTIRFIGNGFLRYMVRNMVGTLIEIGEHKRTPEEILEILKKENRIYAGKTAKPEGLYLVKVTY